MADIDPSTGRFVHAVPSDPFWGRVRKSRKCWIWTGSKFTNSGYGNLRYEGKVQSAHRVAWMLTYGAIPRGKGHHGVCVLHRCDNRLCVNPEHLFLGTMAENRSDCVRKRRHAHGERHARAKPTDGEVLHIIELRSKGATQVELAKRFGVSQRTIRQIIDGDGWKHLQ